MKQSRYALIFGFYKFFWLISFIVRTALLVISFTKADLTFFNILTVYFKGFVFDTAVATFFCLPYSIYLLILPQKLNKTTFNRWFTYIGFFITLLIIMFSFFAEFTFWEEFECRFNFIAVDYLIYTYEVVNNINQSYPLPLLISGMVLVTTFIMWLFLRRKTFRKSFESKTYLASRLKITGLIIAASTVFIIFLSNSRAETSHNRYQNELSKAGIFSFFAAFRNNELDYYAFYQKEDEAKVFNIMRKELADSTVMFIEQGNSIRRKITSTDSIQQKPNIILITIESFSANFMKRFGNTEGITPHIDSLANNSILFTDMYATGTRTIRGMEALTLSIPPTPGSSIVRRPDNKGLFNVSSIFNKEGYKSTFIYGGDGYFDNMNAFFGNNGFDIIDRGRNIAPGDKFIGSRNTIPDSEVTYENAWGLCDEDIYNASIRDADAKHSQNQPFFHFVMTTSNHRPFTYPEGKIDIPSGSGREGAVKYTDYAVGQFIHSIQSKPWFENTIVIIVADHCASSAGKNEIDVSKYHIPCIIYNLHTNDSIKTIDKQCSQLDLFPTLLSMLGWSYESNLYGKNVLADNFSPRTFVGTYQKLGYIQGDNIVILSPQQKSEAAKLNATKTEQQLMPMDNNLLNKAIGYYQSAYYLFKNGGMLENPNEKK